MIENAFTRARRRADGSLHTTQMREFFALMGWPAAPAPIIPEKIWHGNKFAEEYGELRAALADEDAVGVADGLGDMAYVVVATMLNYGVVSSLEHFFWSVPGQRNSSATTLTAALEDLDGSVAQMRSVGTNPYAARWHGLRALRGIDEMAALTGTPMVPVFTEIHRSNMTKTAARGVPVKSVGYQPPVLGPLLSQPTEPTAIEAR